jgi:Holliday junction resolvase RusA-like endonuclease
MIKSRSKLLKNEQIANEFKLTGRIVPKARPRLSGSRVHLPENYRNWKELAVSDLIDQKTPDLMPIKSPILLSVEYHGSAVGDADNIIGSIMDALVAAQILHNDGLNIVSSLSFVHIKSKAHHTQIKLTSCHQ